MMRNLKSTDTFNGYRFNISQKNLRPENNESRERKKEFYNTYNRSLTLTFESHASSSWKISSRSNLKICTDKTTMNDNIFKKIVLNSFNS